MSPTRYDRNRVYGDSSRLLHYAVSNIKQSKKIETLISSSTAANIYQSTQHNIPQDFKFYKYRCKNLKSRNKFPKWQFVLRLLRDINHFHKLLVEEMSFRHIRWAYSCFACVSSGYRDACQRETEYSRAGADIARYRENVFLSTTPNLALTRNSQLRELQSRRGRQTSRGNASLDGFRFKLDTPHISTR